MKEIIKQVALILLPYKMKIYFLFCISMLLSAFSSLEPYLYKIFLDRVIVNKEIFILQKVIWSFVILFIINTVLTCLVRFETNGLKNKIRFFFRIRILNSFITLPMSEVIKLDIGESKLTLIDDVEIFENIVSDEYVVFIQNILLITFNIIFLAIISLKMLFLSIIIIPIVYIISIVIANLSKSVNGKNRELTADYVSWMNEHISNWKEIKVSCLESKVFFGFDEKKQRIAELSYKWIFLWFLRGLLSWLKEEFFSKLVIYFIGGILIVNGLLTIGSLVCFSLYFSRIFHSVDSLNRAYIDFVANIPIYKRVIFRLKNSVSIKTENKLDRINTITFDSLSISYSQKMIIKDINYKFTRPNAYVLFGRSGVGKTSMFKILLKMISTNKGNIYINGINLECIEEKDLFDKISVVMQDPYIYNLSIKDNLIFGNTAKSKNEIDEVLLLVGFKSYVDSLPDGLDTIMAERGSGLSGGEKNKLAICRCLLRDKDVLLFDEAISSLDRTAEKKILDYIKNIGKTKLILLVDHRQTVREFFCENIELGRN